MQQRNMLSKSGFEKYIKINRICRLGTVGSMYSCVFPSLVHFVACGKMACSLSLSFTTLFDRLLIPSYSRCPLSNLHLFSWQFICRWSSILHVFVSPWGLASGYGQNTCTSTSSLHCSCSPSRLFLVHLCSCMVLLSYLQYFL